MQRRRCRPGPKASYGSEIRALVRGEEEPQLSTACWSCPALSPQVAPFRRMPVCGLQDGTCGCGQGAARACEGRQMSKARVRTGGVGPLKVKKFRQGAQAHSQEQLPQREAHQVKKLTCKQQNLLTGHLAFLFFARAQASGTWMRISQKARSCAKGWVISASVQASKPLRCFAVRTSVCELTAGGGEWWSCHLRRAPQGHVDT